MKINWSEPGVPISAFVHAGLLLAALISFSSAPDYQITPDTISVEMVTDAELTAMTRGDKTQKQITPDAKIKAQKAPEESAVKADSADAKKDVPTPTPQPAPEPKPEPQPDPKPQPTPPQPPAPTPPAPPPPPPPAPAEIPAPPPPPPKPEPKFEADKIAKLLETKAPPKKAEPSFNASSIEKLLQSKEAPQKSASRASDASSKSNAGTETGSAQKLSVTLRDQLSGMIRDQLQRCWSPPAWVTGAEKLRPVIQIRLDEGGALMGQPVVVSPSSDIPMRAMEESAVRAVQKCTPLKIPQQFRSYYSDWKDISITFDISAML